MTIGCCQSMREKGEDSWSALAGTRFARSGKGYFWSLVIVLECGTLGITKAHGMSLGEVLEQ